VAARAGAAPGGGALPWALPVLVVLVVLAESAQVHVEIRRQTVSLSLSELPLVLGLFLLDPLPLLLARVVGGLLVTGRRGRPRTRRRSTRRCSAWR
jgi:hypothetical protein